MVSTFLNLKIWTFDNTKPAQIGKYATRQTLDYRIIMEKGQTAMRAK